MQLHYFHNIMIIYNLIEFFVSCIYCKYEIPDHKVGIYCNVIGPLAALRHMHFRAKRF